MFVTEKKRAFNEIDKKLKQGPIIIFMRGSSSYPKCKASKLLMESLYKMEIDFKDFDVLED